VNRVEPGDVLGYILGNTSLERTQIGAIFIFPKHTFVDVNEAAVQTVEALNGSRFRARELAVRRAF
jgi:hypothetical protein